VNHAKMLLLRKMVQEQASTKSASKSLQTKTTMTRKPQVTKLLYGPKIL